MALTSPCGADDIVMLSTGLEFALNDTCLASSDISVASLPKQVSPLGPPCQSCHSPRTLASPLDLAGAAFHSWNPSSMDCKWCDDLNYIFFEDDSSDECLDVEPGSDSLQFLLMAMFS